MNRVVFCCSFQQLVGAVCLAPICDLCCGDWNIQRTDPAREKDGTIFSATAVTLF